MKSPASDPESSSTCANTLFGGASVGSFVIVVAPLRLIC